ncbi:hypothetical protein D3C87_1916660 [compost metagenome]
MNGAFLPPDVMGSRSRQFGGNARDALTVQFGGFQIPRKHFIYAGIGGRLYQQAN